MSTTAIAESSGQSAWNHAVKTYGDMGQQTAGANGAIKITGGKRQSRKQTQRQSRKQRQSQKGGKRHRHSKRHSQRQRGGRR